MSQICPGSCNSSYRRATALYHAAVAAYDQQLAALPEGDPVPEPPAPPDVTPWEGDPVWCSRCQTVIRRSLAELDDLAAQLAAIPPGVRPASDVRREAVKVTVSQGHPSPSPSADVLDELQRWLTGWEGDYRQERGWPSPPPRGLLSTVITASCAWLGEHLSGPAGLLAWPHAEDFGSQALRWHRELRARAHASSFARHVKKPCPACTRYTLWERVGEDYVSCVYQECGRRLTREELARLPA